MKLKNAINLFIERKAKNLIAAKGVASPRTLETYKTSLQLFSRFVKEKYQVSSINIQDITEDDITDFLCHCREEGNQGSTINTRLNSIKTAWKELAKKIELKDITEGVPKVKHKYKRQPSVSKEHVKIIMNHFKGIKHKNKTNYRNYIFYTTISLFGLRISEALDLKISKMFFLDGILKIDILGKGNKPRMGYLPLSDKKGKPLPEHQEFYKDLKYYIKEILPEFDIQKKQLKDNLFFSQSKDKWDRESARVVFSRILKKLKLALYKYSPHSLRHAFASRLLAAGVPLQTVSVLLGHSNVAITAAIYAHSEEQDLINAMSEGNFLG